MKQLLLFRISFVFFGLIPLHGLAHEHISSKLHSHNEHQECLIEQEGRFPSPIDVNILESEKTALEFELIPSSIEDKTCRVEILRFDQTKKSNQESIISLFEMNLSAKNSEKKTFSISEISDQHIYSIRISSLNKNGDVESTITQELYYTKQEKSNPENLKEPYSLSSSGKRKVVVYLTKNEAANIGLTSDQKVSNQSKQIVEVDSEQGDEQ